MTYAVVSAPFLILITLVLMSFPATATEVNLYCHVPTTVFNVTSSAAGIVTSSVTHPYGIQFTPLYSQNWQSNL